MRQEFIKSTGPGGISIHNFAHFSLPKIDQPGVWMPDCAENRPLRPHFWGYHLARPDFIADWFGAENYWAEADGDVVVGHGCVVARRIRLIEKIAVTDQQWSILAHNFIVPVIDLVRESGFPHAYTGVVEPAFQAISHWVLGGDQKATEARDLVEQTILLVGRNYRDGLASYEWSAHSHMVMQVAGAVVMLAYLRRQDEQRLIDRSPSWAQAQLLRKPLLQDLHRLGTGIVGCPESNFRVAKNICGLTAMAAKYAVEQRTWHQETLTARQTAWVQAARVPPFSPIAYQALSGLRAIQSQEIGRVLNI